MATNHIDIVQSMGGGSSFDTQKIITGLMAVKQVPITTVETKKEDSETKLSSLGNIVSDVQSLKSTFESFKCEVDVNDPLVHKDDAKKELNINLVENPKKGSYDAVILSVAHDEFKSLSVSEIKEFGKPKHVIYDVKYLLDQAEVDGRL